MKISRSQHILLSIATGLYTLAASWFLDPFGIIQELPTWIDWGIITITPIILVFVILQIAKSTTISQPKILSNTSFLISILITGIIAWFISDANHDNFILFNTSFFITGLPITIIAFAYTTLSQIRKKQLTSNQATDDSIEINYFELKNTKGRTTFKTDYNSIICFEANDNYCTTYFLNNEEKLDKSLDRISLKAIEQMLEQDRIKFERVHKSYIINPSFLEDIKGNAQSYKLELKHFEASVPVSRKYNVDTLR